MGATTFGVIAAVVLLILLVREWNSKRKLEEQLILSESDRRDLRSKLQGMVNLRDSILQSVPDGLIVLDSGNHIQLLNPAAEKLLGRSQLGETLIAVTRSEELDTLVGEADINTAEPAEKRLLFNHRNIRATAICMKSGEDMMNILMLHDETELRRLSRARREMVANISHELRTPITTINLLTETLLNTSFKREKDSKKLIKSIQQESATLTQLVQEMRDLSLIESGQMPVRLTPTNLTDIVQSSFEALHSLAERKEQTIEINLPPQIYVLADPDKIERVLRNIIHNAIKYTKDGGHIQIEAHPEDQEVTISVRDNGPGISEENLPRIFERFFQEDSARGDGTGLGLAIARHIVRGHGGEIWAESTPGEGSTFSFTLVQSDEIPPEAEEPKPDLDHAEDSA